jgi:hypothetical protein
MNLILFIALFVVFVFNLLVGVFGFLTFYDKYSLSSFPGEILRCYTEKGDALTTIANWTILLTILAATPLLLHPCRDFTIAFFFKKRTISTVKYMVVLLMICLLALVLTITCPSIIVIITIVGSVSSPFV